MTKNIYTLTSQFPETEKFGLISQLRRASISVCSNLAEGTSRKTRKDKEYFTTIAYSSTMEILNQLIIANELDFINNRNYQECRLRIDAIANKLNALKKSQLRS